MNKYRGVSRGTKAGAQQIVDANFRLMVPPKIAKLSPASPKPFKDPVFNSQRWDETKKINFHGLEVKLIFSRQHQKDGSKNIFIYLPDDPNQSATCRLDLNAFGGIQGSKINFIPANNRNIYRYILQNYRKRKIDKKDASFRYLQGLSENSRLLKMKDDLPRAPNVLSHNPGEKARNVKQNKAAVSTTPLTAIGLNTCTAISFSYGKTNFLSHVDATTNPNMLIKFISKHFDVSKLKKDTNFKIYLFFGDSETNGSYLVIMKALEKLGLTGKAHIACEAVDPLKTTVGIYRGSPFMY